MLDISMRLINVVDKLLHHFKANSAFHPSGVGK